MRFFCRKIKHILSYICTLHCRASIVIVRRKSFTEWLSSLLVHQALDRFFCFILIHTKVNVYLYISVICLQCALCIHGILFLYITLYYIHICLEQQKWKTAYDNEPQIFLFKTWVMYALCALHMYLRKKYHWY